MSHSAEQVSFCYAADARLDVGYLVTGRAGGWERGAGSLNQNHINYQLSDLKLVLSRSVILQILHRRTNGCSGTVLPGP